MKTTYYNAAKNYEISKDYEKAIEYYEKSNTFRKEVPRMFLEVGDTESIEKYVEIK